MREALHLSLSLPNISVRWYSHGDKLRSNYLPCLFLFVASTVLSCLTFVCRHAQCFHSINTGFSFVFRIWNRTGIGDFFGAHIYLSIYIYPYIYIYIYIYIGSGTGVERVGAISIVIIASIIKIMTPTSIVLVNIAIIHHSSFIVYSQPPVACHQVPVTVSEFTSSLCMASTCGHKHKVCARKYKHMWITHQC